VSLQEHHWKPPGGVWTDEIARADLAARKVAAGKHRADYTRLYTRRGMVAHLSPNWRGTKAALCPVVPKWPGEWLGTGSQAEYELAAEMETCKRCYEAFMLSVECGNPQCPCHRPLGRRL
jgi:hypothetical protein